MDELISRGDLVKQGMKGFGGVISGFTLLALSGLPSVFGWIVGGLLTVVGLGIGASREDRMAGAVTAGVGILTLVSQIGGIGQIPHTLMRLGGIGLLAGGVFFIIKFFMNLKKRS